MSIEQNVGRLAGLVEAMQNDMTEVKKDVKSLLAEKHQRKGGWKVVVGISAAVAAVTAFLSDLMGLGR
jgi:hypothetical protein